MNNDEFSYFFHGTTIKDSSLINEIFDNGLINYRGNDMLSTMWPMKISNGELGQKMKEYAGTKGNAVFVIKIPKYYLTPRTSNGKLQQILYQFGKPCQTPENMEKYHNLALN